MTEQQLWIDCPNPRFRRAEPGRLMEARIEPPTAAEVKAREQAHIPPTPSDAEAAELPFEPYSPNMVLRRRLPKGGAIYWAHSKFVRSIGPDVEVPEGGEWDYSQQSDPVRESLKQTHTVLGLFQSQLWPRYSADPLTVRLQTSLREIGATVYWQPRLAEWVVVVNPTGRPREDLELLLHEAIHVRDGHVQKVDRLPPWVLPTGLIAEKRLLEVISRRDNLREGYGYLQEREIATDQQASAEVEAIWPATR